MDWDGERDLTADEAAEYLKPWLENIIYFNGQFKVAFWLEEHGEMSSSRSLKDERAETLTKALNAACRAVRSKGCQK